TFAQRLSMLPGVAQVNVFGSQKYAVRIQLDPGALASRGVGIDEVQTSVEDQSVHLPVGTLMDAHRLYTVEVNGQLHNAAEFGALIVAYKNGAPVRLDELGRVLDSTQYDRTYTSYNGARAVIIAIQRQPGYNTVATVNAVKALMEKLQRELPADL